METLEFTRVESVKGTMPGGIGGMIHYSVEGISHEEYSDYTDLAAARTAIQRDINVLAEQGIDNGEFLSSFAVWQENGRALMVTVRGTFCLAPDYRLLRRVVRWKYNYDPSEAVTAEDFRQAYGQAFGDHFYSKWISGGSDITAMIAYFADDIDNGQRFVEILMRRVCQYENQTRERR